MKRISKVTSSLTDEIMAKMMDDSLDHMVPILEAKKHSFIENEANSPPRSEVAEQSLESNSFLGNASFDLNKISAVSCL